MKMKRKHLSILCALLILTGAMPAHALAVETDKSRVGVESEELSNVETWQEYATYLMSHQLCGGASNQAEAASPEQGCQSLIAELAAEAEESQHNAPILENVDWDGAAQLTETALDSGALNDDGFGSAGLDDKGVGDKVAVSKTEDTLEADGVDNAIPGSLLVTILALVGIVAVARRDVSGKQSPDVLVRSGDEVARIPSIPEDAKVDIVHGRLN